LKRKLICRGLKSRLLIEPQVCIFPRKVILNNEKFYPLIEDLILSNPEKLPIAWHIKASDLADDVF